MPLLDHFRPPLSERRHWEAFHTRWATAISDALNEVLPHELFAEPQVHAGPRVEIDVATWNESGSASNGDGAVATLTSAPAKLRSADLTIAMNFPPSFGVHILETSGGPTLVAAIELVSPANKDRDETRRAFASKCFSLLAAGCGLIVVDVVTNRLSRPFDELKTLLQPDGTWPMCGPLTAASYRPIRTNEIDSLEVRVETLGVGRKLPTLPLALPYGEWVDVDLEETYSEACEKNRI